MPNLTIQQRIRKRRNDFGASLDKAAAWAGLPAERWRAIEGGEALSVAELGRVSRALAVDPGILLRGDEGNPRRSVARFRQAAIETGSVQPRTLRILALAAELGRIGGALHQLLAKPLPLAEVRTLEPPSTRQEPWKQGYRLGAAARHRLGIATGPIHQLQATLEQKGIHIASLDFASRATEAASVFEPGAMPIILLNEAAPRSAQTLSRRSTMAHELCHLLHDAGENDLETRLSGREELALDDPLEQRARAFAPAFLAPPEEVKHWFRTGAGKHQTHPENRVLTLAKRWGLSWTGAVWHAKNCQLIQHQTAERLKDEVPESQDWHQQFERTQASLPAVPIADDLSVSPLCRGRLAELVLEAQQGGAISLGRAREILSWG